MKAIFKTAALAVLVSLASCKKDENNDGNNNNNTSGDLKTNIVGTWEVTALEQNNGEMSSQGQSMGTFEGTGRDFLGEMIFNADGTASGDIGYALDLSMTFAIPGFPSQTMTQTQMIPQTSASGTYEVVSNSKLKTTAFGDGASNTTFDVVSYSASTLELGATLDSTMTQQGQSVNTKFDLYISLKKK